MKLILLVVLGICGNTAISQHISIENRLGQGGGGSGFGGHPNRAAPGEVYRPKYTAPTKDTPPPIELPAGMSMHKYQHMRSHYLAYVKYVDRQIFDARHEIERYGDYEIRSELLDASEEALKHAHECFKYHSYDYGVDYLAIAETALDLATSMTPGVGWARDVYETLTGKDAISGKKLSYLEHTFAIIGAVTGGLGSKLKAPYTMLGHMIKGSGLYGKTITEYAEKITKANSPKIIKEIHAFFRKHKDHIPEDLHKSFEKAFAHPTRVTVTQADVKVYRYYRPDGNPRGQWVTTVKYDNPKEVLALPGNPMPDPKEWILPKGTEVLEGRVASNFGEIGGGYQIFIPNPGVLK